MKASTILAVKGLLKGSNIRHPVLKISLETTTEAELHTHPLQRFSKITYLSLFTLYQIFVTIYPLPIQNICQICSNPKARQNKLN